MIEKVLIDLVIVFCVLGVFLAYKIYSTIIPEPSRGVVEIAYMAEPTLDLDGVAAEFNPSRMVTILCDGSAIGHDEDYTCMGEDGTPLCDGSPYKILAFFDPPDGTLSIDDGDSDYTCKETSGASTTCYLETFNQWRRAHAGTEGLDKCPADESLYAPYGKCYFRRSQSGKALEYAKEYIKLNDWKCISK